MRWVNVSLSYNAAAQAIRRFELSLKEDEDKLRFVEKMKRKLFESA